MENWRIAFEHKIRKIRDYHAKAELKEITPDYVNFKQSQAIGYPRLTRIADFIWHLAANFDLNLRNLSQKDVESVLI